MALCYICDELIVPHHKCKRKYFFLVSQEENFDETNLRSPQQSLDNVPQDMPQTYRDNATTPHISLHQ